MTLMTPATDTMPRLTSAELSALIDDTLMRVGDFLDADKRAWIVGGMVFANAKEDVEENRVELDELIQVAFTADGYPAVPFPFEPAEITWRPFNQSLISTRSRDLGDDMHFDVALATDRRAWLGEAMTRAVVGPDGTVNPTHVMLTDVEAVLTDAISLGRSLTTCTGYAGPAVLVLQILCDNPTVPLELRAFDEFRGDTLRPEVGFSEFTPLRVPVQFPLSDSDEAQLLWQVSRDVAAQFGVLDPQLIEHP